MDAQRAGTEGEAVRSGPRARLPRQCRKRMAAALCSGRRRAETVDTGAEGVKSVAGTAFLWEMPVEL